MQLSANVETGAFYQFDNYTLDPDSRTLKDGDTPVDLTPKVFTTLLVLIENRDKVLTKDELLSLIWPDQFVDLSNLSQNISVLRRRLRETESGKKYIATFPGRGYRFVGSVRESHREDDAVAEPIALASPVPNEMNATWAPAQPNPLPEGARSWRRYWSIVASCVVLLAAVAAFTVLDRRNSQPGGVVASDAPVKTFARMNAALFQPSWSRDGKAIAFVAMDMSGARSAIYIQSKRDIQPQSLVSGPGQYSSPAWSPDGTHLAFLHFEPGSAELVIFDTQNKSSRVLTKLFARRYGLNYRHLDWSPDGQFLVVDDKTRDSEPFSLYLIYIGSGQRVRLTYPDSDMVGDVAPSVSPDSTKVAFIRDTYLFEQNVYVANVRGRTYQRVTSTPTLISDVGWDKNNIVAFAANDGDGFRLWQANLTRGGQKSSIASQIDADDALQFSFAPDEKKIALSRYSPNLDIWSIDLSKASNGWSPVIQAHGENIRPSVSPDGKLLAFLSNVSGKFQIWISQIDGTNASALPTGALVPASFCWSSDSKSIIFSPQRVHGLYELPAHGGGPVRQISSIYTDPLMAIDGKSLFVRAHFFIYRLPLSGGNAQEVTEQGGAPIAQSRDGRYLYFSQRRMSTTIARLDLQTGHQDELAISLLPGYSDAWALSSRGIYFLGQEHDQPEIRFFNLATGGEEHIAEFPGDLPPVEMSAFAISPDGKRLWAVRADPMPSQIETTIFRPD